jgi:ABC-type transport system involved in multi-copper enzyme maturation permease subunit
VRASEARPSGLNRFRWLVAKELRELLASRAFWLLLLMIGPLVGHGFITAVDSYAEASGIAGGPAALAQGLSPLDGIFVPTFGAYDLAATLLFPFVAIRLVAAEKASGAWKLLLQSPASPRAMLLAKGVALLAGWLIAWLPGLAALLLWKLYGGTIYPPEVSNLLLGHLLRVILAAGVAIAAGAIANGAASAAIATLGFTVGTWALEFIAAGRGGALQKLASYTPTAALRVFEQGELRLSTVLVTVVIGLAGFVLAAIWLHQGRPFRTRCLASLAALLVFALSVAAASRLRSAWDLSENRRNSFSAADETALARIRRPLRVTVYLSPEDPRLMDLDRNILAKLARILPEVEIVHAAHSRTGLFDAAGDRYGEVWYSLGGRKSMTRSTTEQIVLDNLYQLAQMPPPVRDESAFPGHPLPAAPRGAAWLYYALWPLATALAAWLHLRNWS